MEATATASRAESAGALVCRTVPHAATSAAAATNNDAREAMGTHRANHTNREPRSSFIDILLKILRIWPARGQRRSTVRPSLPVFARFCPSGPANLRLRRSARLPQ
jgi:hypothetical protein